MSKAIIIFGSSKSDGNTRQIVDSFVAQTGAEVIDLNKKEISYFDYEHKNIDDDFIPMMEHVVTHDLIIFATPVYWYSMSAVMKTFFDRLSDLLTIKKDLGRQLKGKNMALISCGSEDDLVAGFSMPFRESADYLDMNFVGELNTWISDSKEGISPEVQLKLDLFVQQLTKKA